MSIILDQYLDALKQQDIRFSVWPDTALPFPKAMIKEAILAAITHPNSSHQYRKSLVAACVALARFVPPDDAQIVKQTERVTLKIAQRLTAGDALNAEDNELLNYYETLFPRIDRQVQIEQSILISAIRI